MALEEPNAHVCFKVILTNLVLLFNLVQLRILYSATIVWKVFINILAYKGNSANALEFSLILYLFSHSKIQSRLSGQVS